jgi:hypothetical protein
MEDVVDDSKIPTTYHEFLSFFSQSTSDLLPARRLFDHAIELKESEELVSGLIYALSEPKLTVLREYLDKMRCTRKIRPSKSPARAPIHFVPKAYYRGLYLYVAFRGLSRVTVLVWNSLLVMNKLCDQVKGSTIFTKIDLKLGYNLVRIKEGEEWKIAFRTCYGYFEYLVIPFGLANTPATFQDMKTEILRDLRDHGVVVYIVDILIYA